MFNTRTRSVFTGTEAPGLSFSTLQASLGLPRTAFVRRDLDRLQIGQSLDTVPSSGRLNRLGLSDLVDQAHCSLQGMTSQFARTACSFTPAHTVEQACGNFGCQWCGWRSFVFPPASPPPMVHLPTIPHDQNDGTEDNNIFDLHGVSLFQKHVRQPRTCILLDFPCLSGPGVVHQFALEYWRATLVQG